MALFKVLRGKEGNLPQKKTDGYSYFTTDGNWYVDYKDTDGIIKRQQLNANDSKTLSGAELVQEIDVDEDSSISSVPTSKAVTAAIKVHANDTTVHLTESEKRQIQELETTYVPQAGGEMTGKLTIGSASIETNGHVNSTWLKTTAATDSNTAATKIAVINNDLIYYRTPDEIRSDINAISEENGQYAVTTTGSGVAYVAKVPGITALTTGVSFMMIPHTVSTSTTPTLNVNNLGAKTIKRRLSSMVTATQAGYSNSWLAANKPFRVVYDGIQWIVDGHDRPVGADVYGAVAQAVGDENGNNIANTYATKTELQVLYPKISSVTITGSNWTGSSSPYSQGVTINGVTSNSKVDFQPTASQIITLQNAGVQLMVENNSGTCTVWALGNKPTSDMTISVLLTETVQI